MKDMENTKETRDINNLVLVYGSPNTPTGKELVAKDSDYFRHACGIHIHEEHEYERCPICGSPLI